MQQIIRRAVWAGCALALLAAPVGAQDAKVIKHVSLPQVSQESVTLATAGQGVRSRITLGGPGTVAVGSVTGPHRGGRGR